MPAEMSEALVHAEAAIMQRASDITTPAEWIGFFEWFTFARLFKVTIFLVFGTTFFNVNAVFGHGFEPYVSTATYRVLAVKLVNGKSSSSVRPDSLLADCNHFEITVPYPGPFAMAVQPLDLTLPVPPSTLTYRQSASAAARDINLTRRATEAAGECGIDTMCFHRGVARTPLNWQELRETLAAEMFKKTFFAVVAGGVFGLR